MQCIALDIILYALCILLIKESTVCAKFKVTELKTYILGFYSTYLKVLFTNIFYALMVNIDRMSTHFSWAKVSCRNICNYYP